MAETFFIADLHFGHRNIVNFESLKPHRHFATVEEHDEALIANWNKVVRPQDDVWVLGDAVFGKRTLIKIARLQGTKRLVMGNHDMYQSRDYLCYFKRLSGAVEWNGMLLTHVPIHPSQFYRYKANIHGHLHTGRIMTTKPDPTDLQYDIEIPDPRYVCVSAEQTNMTPISADVLLKDLKTKGIFL